MGILGRTLGPWTLLTAKVCRLKKVISHRCQPGPGSGSAPHTRSDGAVEEAAGLGAKRLDLPPFPVANLLAGGAILKAYGEVVGDGDEQLAIGGQ